MEARHNYVSLNKFRSIVGQSSSASADYFVGQLWACDVLLERAMATNHSRIFWLLWVIALGLSLNLIVFGLTYQAPRKLDRGPCRCEAVSP